MEIPKPDGRKRLLGIPTVLDRFIQQAIAQVVQDEWESHFHPQSYGFVRVAHPSLTLGTIGCADVLRAGGAGRPGRSAHEAVAYAQVEIRNGFGWVVDIDLDAFFDRVNHDRLMVRLKQHCPDQALLRLINRYLKAGVWVAGRTEASTAGVPQGGPLSPVLSNVVLDELDWELDRRGHRFARYADDCVPRRRTRGRKSSVQPCCTRDEGRPPGAGVQAQAPNHLLLRRLRGAVVSETGNGRA
ncbi:MAG: reverse transcriptase domain-containing protein [Rhodocyclaceae bacterium]